MHKISNFSIFPFIFLSGLNIISEFNLENTTVYSTGDDILSDVISEKGDTAEEGEIPSSNQRFVNYILIFFNFKCMCLISLLQFHCRALKNMKLFTSIP